MNATYPQELGYRPHEPGTWTKRYAELKSDQVMQHYKGYWEGDKPAMTHQPVPAGTTVKIVMVSRFGDVGVTENLDAETGYGLRVPLAELVNLRDRP